MLLWFCRSVCASHLDLENGIETKQFRASSSNLADMLTTCMRVVRKVR